MHTHAGWEGQGRIHGGGHGTGWTFSDQCQRYVHRRLASSLWRVEPARGFFPFSFSLFFSQRYVCRRLASSLWRVEPARGFFSFFFFSLLHQRLFFLYGEWSRQEVFFFFFFLFLFLFIFFLSMSMVCSSARSPSSFCAVPYRTQEKK